MSNSGRPAVVASSASKIIAAAAVVVGISNGVSSAAAAGEIRDSFHIIGTALARRLVLAVAAGRTLPLNFVVAFGR